MIPELGVLFLILALFSALFLVCSARTVKYYVMLEAMCVVLSYSCLTGAFLSDDFTVRYVLLNSSISLPWFYKLCAVWGGHEGSMLLWVLILNGWMVAIALLSPRLEPAFYTRVLRILGMLSIGFLLFLLLPHFPSGVLKRHGQRG